MASPHNDNVVDEETAKTLEKIEQFAKCCSHTGTVRCFCLRDKLFPSPDSKSLYLIPFPELVVSASEVEVFIHSETVCASSKLRRRVTRYMQEYFGWARGDNARLSKAYIEHSDTIRQLKFIDCTEDLHDGTAKDNFGRLPMLSSEVWLLLDKWCLFHIHQVKAEAEKIKAEKNRIDWNKPLPPLPKPKDWNAISKFEEDMFGDMDPETFLAFVQGKNDLGLSDLHKVTENWFRLYKGRDVVLDSDGNAVASQLSQPAYNFIPNFRMESNHWLEMPGFYQPRATSVPNNAKEWTWWNRGKYGNKFVPDLLD